METDKFFEQLMLLRGMTEATGILHDAQVLQLQGYGYVFSPNITKCEVSVNLDKHEIDYHISTDRKKVADFKSRCKMLTEWVHKLLGPTWMVRVVNTTGRKVHTGMRKKKYERGQASTIDSQAK